MPFDSLIHLEHLLNAQATVLVQNTTSVGLYIFFLFQTQKAMYMMRKCIMDANILTYGRVQFVPIFRHHACSRYLAMLASANSF